jgi:hypothetical protein
VTITFAPTTEARFTNTVIFSSTGGNATNLVTGTGTFGIRLLILSTHTLHVSEGGTATFTMTMNVQPQNNTVVTIAKQADGDPDLSIEPSSFTFTASNWNQPQTFVARAAPDQDSVNGQAMFTLSSPDLSADDQILILEIDSTQFVSFAGTYYGLAESDPPEHARSGFVTITTAADGGFKAQVLFGGTKYKIAGRFDANGDATVVIHRQSGGPLTVLLHLDVTEGTDQITGTVSDGTFISDLLANRAVFSKKGPLAPQAGSYTLVIPGDASQSGAAAPQGDGFGLLAVDGSGVVKFKGALGDGSKTKLNKAAISKYGTYPFYAPLYRNTGSIFGWATFTNIVGASDLSGSLHWFKPLTATDVFYPSGFTAATELIGSKYVAPPPGTPPSGLANALITIGEGNLPATIVKHVTVDGAGNVAVLDPGADALTMKIAVSTGQFSGTFIHPTSGLKTKFQGALIQKQQLGGGNFLGVDQTGFVTIEPAP